MLLSRAGNLGTLGLYNAGTGPTTQGYYASWLGALGTMLPNTNITFITHGGACDTLGNMYVVGQWNPSNQRYWNGSILTGTWQSNGLLVKLDKNGNIVWQQMLGSPTEITQFYNVTLHDNHVYVMGNSLLSGSYYVVVAKYTINGVLVWQKKLTSVATNFGSITNGGVIKFDGSGNIFVMTDTCIVKLDSSGNVVWGKQLFTTSQYCRDFVIGPTGSIYISALATVSGSYSRQHVIKLDTTGSILWQKYASLATTAGTQDLPNSIILDSSENVYIVGGIESVSFAPNVRHPGSIFKFDSSGNYLAYNLLIYATAGHNTYLYEIAIDNLTNTLYISGSDTTITGFIAVMDTNLNVILIHKYTPVSPQLSGALNISDGKLYYVGKYTGAESYVCGDFPLTITPPGVATSWTITKPTGTTLSLSYNATSNIAPITSAITVGTNTITSTTITVTGSAGTLVDQTAYSNPPIYTVSSYKTFL